MIQLKNLTKIYNTNGNSAVGLNKVNLTMNKGEFIGIVGPSGSGKTTLLNVVSGMDSYEEGELILFGQETSSYKREDFEKYRRNNVAFIFQNYQLIDSYTALNNVVIELLFKGIPLREAKKEAKDILIKVGLGHRLKNRASKLSGGEKQRVVIARALASDCQILACDEPTGNLDTTNSIEIINLLKEISQDKLVLFVTHEADLLKDVATRMITIKDGNVDSDVVSNKVDVKETSALVEKKINWKVNLYIAYKNLISTPKRTILLLLLFIITTFGITTEVASTDLSMIYSQQYREIYNNPTKNRLIVYDNVDFENSIKVQNDAFLDEAISLKYTDTNLSSYSAYIGVSFKNTVDYGRIPEKSNEIILETFNPFISAYESSIETGKVKIEINEIEYIVVGAKISEVLDDTLYFYNNEIPKLECDLTKDVVLTNNNKRLSFNSKQPQFQENKLLGLPIGTDISKLKITLGEVNVPITENNVEYFDGSTYSINQDYLSNFAEDNIYRTSLFFKDSDEAKAAYNKLIKDYDVVYPDNFEYVKDAFYYFDLVITVITLVILVLTIIGLLFLISTIAYLILKTTIKDFTIMRIIGLDKKDIRVVILFQNIITFLVAYIFVVITMNIAGVILEGSFIDRFMGISDMVSNMLKFKYLSITLISLLFTATFISLKHHNKMFKNTASTNLRGGDLL